MGISQWLIDKEKKFAWSLLGTILGVVSLVVTYVTIQEKTPAITYFIAGESNVFDVHASLPNLEILYPSAEHPTTESKPAYPKAADVNYFANFLGRSS